MQGQKVPEVMNNQLENELVFQNQYNQDAHVSGSLITADEQFIEVKSYFSFRDYISLNQKYME